MKKLKGAIVLAVMATMGWTSASAASGNTPEKAKERVELPKAETIVVKVAVVIEDPIIDGKRFHEWMNWEDPYKTYPKYEEALEKCSDGVVDYQIVKVIEADKMYTYFGDKPDKYVTPEDLKRMFIDDKGWTEIRQHERGGSVHYDYLPMAQAYGFDKMRDKEEINEVWVYSWPINGMNESRFVGKGGFWLNSTPTPGATNKKLLTVMYCNYERNLACAMESYGHRVESTMIHVYGRWLTCPPAKELQPDSKLNNWELYSSYDKIRPGKGHVGNVHYPVNATHDYEWNNPNKVYTYQEAWKYYPDIREIDPEYVDCSKWDCSQLGRMMNFHSHLPNKAGINPEDGKLNNWWHYIVNYNDAVKLEKKLSKKLSKQK